jgi:hypothetical protein
LLAARTGPLQVQGPFFGYFLLGLEKKVTRLPAGTGEVKVLFFPLSIQPELKTVGTRPDRRLTFCKPTKSKQKTALHLQWAGTGSKQLWS